MPFPVLLIWFGFPQPLEAVPSPNRFSSVAPTNVFFATVHYFSQLLRRICINLLLCDFLRRRELFSGLLLC